ncbi:Transposase [Quadrisphaera granulorum]|uniref:Transposase-like protein n=1 Tax=Quadrisphaera granulorum TaxID=317664 RepID=A0A315ZHU9_9ACTN|nr:hypothetical protein [Quadrisphaera granulorum]PWJ45111.1 transposase-like protein [Quadrisphaera granulorum]SZE99201.1 Transposase [Quadrisphaera granulorum]
MTVELDPAHVEARLAAGALTCPACTAVLGGWGWARPRMIRNGDRRVRLAPRRARCTGCAVTHVLLPVIALVRRADAAVVIGWALTARAAGRGHRWIADRLGVPAGTVRGWLRRFGARLAGVEAFFTAAGIGIAVDPVLPGTGGSGWADAVGALLWFAGLAAAGFTPAPVRAPAADHDGAVPADLHEADPASRAWVWAAISAACHGQLLSPAWPSTSGSLGSSTS